MSSQKRPPKLPCAEVIAFGYNLKVARLRLGKSLRDVGAEARASPILVSRVERGLVLGVTLEKAAELAAAVDEPLYRLLSYFPTEKQVADLRANADPTIVDMRVSHRHSSAQAAEKVERLAKRKRPPRG